MAKFDLVNISNQLAKLVRFCAPKNLPFRDIYLSYDFETRFGRIQDPPRWPVGGRIKPFELHFLEYLKRLQLSLK